MTTDRAWLMRRRSDIVNALGAVKDDPTGTGRSVVAQCMQVVADELQRLVDEIAPPITSAPELAAAYGIAWPADSCHCCGARILDGRCCSWDNPEIRERPVHCVCPKGQGPVAVQRSGFGAS